MDRYVQSVYAGKVDILSMAVECLAVPHHHGDVVEGVQSTDAELIDERPVGGVVELVMAVGETVDSVDPAAYGQPAALLATDRDGPESEIECVCQQAATLRRLHVVSAC